MWQSPDIVGIDAAEGRRSSIVESCARKSAAKKAEPDSMALGVRDRVLQLLDHAGMQQIPCAAMLCEIKPEDGDPNVPTDWAKQTGPLNTSKENGPITNFM